MIEAIAYSALSGMSTLLGVILVLKYGSLSRRGIAFSLGMSVGVMLVVSLGSLLSTAIRYGTWAHVVLGMSAGLLLMILLHHIERPDGEHGDRSSYARLGLLLVLAVAAPILVLNHHPDLAGSLDHVMVGDHQGIVTLFIKNDPRTGSLLHGLLSEGISRLLEVDHAHYGGTSLFHGLGDIAVHINAYRLIRSAAALC